MKELTYDKTNKVWKEGNAAFRLISRKAFQNQVAKVEEMVDEADIADKQSVRKLFKELLQDEFVISGDSDEEFRVTKVWYAWSRKMQYELHVHLMFGKIKVYSHEYYRRNDSKTLYGYKYAPIRDYGIEINTLAETTYFKEETTMTNKPIASEVEMIEGFVKELDFKPQVLIYTDGSWSANQPEVSGWGYVAVHPTKISKDGKNKQIVKIDRGTAPADSRQIGGELKSVMAAVKWAKDKGAKRVEIHYDYEGVERWVTGQWKAKKALSHLYAQWMRKQLKEVDVRFVKVKAHTGNLYNELADQLAKEAITQAQVGE